MCSAGSKGSRSHLQMPVSPVPSPPLLSLLGSESRGFPNARSFVNNPPPHPPGSGLPAPGFWVWHTTIPQGPNQPVIPREPGGDLSLHRGASGRDCEYSCLHWLHQWRDVMLTALTYKPRISMASHDRCLFAHLHISQAGEPGQRESFLQVVI